MGFARKPMILPLLLILLTNLNPNHFADSAASSDYSTIVYKGCSKDTFTDPNGSYSQSLSALFGTLVSQSTRTKFYKATSGSITGLFQCRGDLTGRDCYNCVSRLPVLSDKLCGKTTAARIQLFGCYMSYEVSGFSEISGMQMLYKTCGGTTAAGTGFGERRGTAFSFIENGVVGGHGFYATSYENVYVMGQCEGDVGDSDCGACVKSAVQKAEGECGNAISGQVFLHKCFISYRYYPSGVPRGGSSFSYGSSSSGQNPGKTAAIILGGAAGVAFFVILLLFARNLKKKHDDY
ncbi:hypothetical protein HN51_022536 [Arachis hypogaea]|uniref:Gnk2-homologous domain-containing protein n=2 Tax=Arachis TaxID=3817 RepID=A0A445EBT6_ARAHY|nr:plasmodesmata-located protein 2 [Arachis duranensis]XP_025648086.1 plasmodesmata-located protein 2 [Arachis hypogaea]XP_057741232.1 plasmodesmata-located protein 2-like [Arachis stenosperma]QHO53781.1 Cysteine-rich repeat secretory protein [Arachis hypogaea]RYR72994.1 hypothetical protein Ahy_A02g007251 [Arachis hypogaea]